MYKKYVKRAIDVILSGAGIVVLAIPMLIIALAIKLDSKGPVLFKQKRVGLHKTYFEIYKFRTMRIDTPHDAPTHELADPEQWITKVGKILRKTSLDELPQLFNVFKGDMSFVGPRPERQYFIDKIRRENPNYDYVFLMRPGLTSMATVYNGYTDTMEKMLVRLDMDLEYLKTRSLWVDIKLIFITVFYIVNGKKF